MIYESDISAPDYTDPADDIDLKICTNVDDKLSLSSVMVGGTFMENATIPVRCRSPGIPEEGFHRKGHRKSMDHQGITSPRR